MTSSSLSTPCAYQSLLDPAILNHPHRRWVVKVMDLLKARQFKALQELLQPHWAAYEAHALSDWGLSQTWPHLDLRRVDLLEPAAEWARAYPESFAAQVFAAYLRCSVAWEARGVATSDCTSEKQFAVMQEHFDAAYPYLHRALDLAARPTLAIAVGLMMTRAGQDDPAHDYIALARHHLPHSPLLYERMMWALNPKWGGSMEAMQSLHQSAQAWSAAWPKDERYLVKLCYDMEQADVAVCNGQADRALAMLRSAAHDLPGSGTAHSRLASQYNVDDQMPQAIDHMLQALRIQPGASRLYALGGYYQQTGRHDLALACFEEAMLWGSGAAAGAMVQRLSEELPQASPSQKPALEQQIGQAAQHGLQQYSPETPFVLGAIEYFQRADAAARQRAYGWWRQAAEWGHAAAMFNLGILHFDGDEGAPVNKALGIDFFTQSAEQGNWGAHQRLGHAYLHGDGVAQDDDRAAYHLEFAADGENVHAMRQWVFCLWFGRGTAQDRDAARQVLRRLKALDAEQYRRAREEIGWGASIKNLMRRWFR